ncbi:MAG: hypothetical protein L6V85_06035 [Clostridiales bacterium]|nr:MAG: hypothetical protein L6V85_06035 [Clostridiales bacterium]
MSEFDTLDAYKADIKAGLEKNKPKNAPKSPKKNKRVEAIVKKTQRSKSPNA